MQLPFWWLAVAEVQVVAQAPLAVVAVQAVLLRLLILLCKKGLLIQS
jgi:hypothetical protein